MQLKCIPIIPAMIYIEYEGVVSPAVAPCFCPFPFLLNLIALVFSSPVPPFFGSSPVVPSPVILTLASSPIYFLVALISFLFPSQVGMTNNETGAKFRVDACDKLLAGERFLCFATFAEIKLLAHGST